MQAEGKSDQAGVDNFIPKLNASHYKQLVVFFSSHLVNHVKVSEPQDNSSISHSAGICLSTSLCGDVKISSDLI